MIENEKEHISELQNGSKDAFEQLYHGYAPRLYGFVRNLTKSNDLAEEIVQETFIKIWDNREYIRTDYSFKSYLFMIARNHVINVFRKQSLISTLEECDTIQNSIDFSENDTDKLAELNELKMYIEKAKLHLSPRQREIFELSKEKGLTNQEIADKLKISNQSVKNQLSTSLHVLQSYFDARMWAMLPLLYFFIDQRGEI
ncbi:MAG: RNA polymerase sigma-70 factor [Bacteroidota bacterium]|nr:RNA polymerase sigma-70 factor [Bacteroidota bacterium]